MQLGEPGGMMNGDKLGVLIFKINICMNYWFADELKNVFAR